MKVDVSRSVHHESASAGVDFGIDELKKLRILLRRLRFLEQQVRKSDITTGGNGGAVFAELEADALEFALTEIGFLAEKQPTKTGASK